MKIKPIYYLLVIVIILAACKQQTEFKANAPDGLQISYTDHGSGEPALVFVHGWSCDKSYWKNQVPAFSDNYRVITIDYGGHGQSGTQREKFTIESFGSDVVAVLEKLQPNEVILIGHSMGGQVILEAASQIPEKVGALIGVDTYQQFTDTTFTPEIFEEYTAPFYSDFTSSTDQFVRDMFPENADQNLVDEIATDMSSANPRIAMQAFESMFKYGDKIPGTLSELNIPVYAINADLWPTNETYNKTMAKDFKVSYMPGYGHFIMLENPELFNEKLQEMIDEIQKQ